MLYCIDLREVRRFIMRARAYVTTMTMTISAEHGTSMMVVKNKPARLHIKEMAIDKNMIALNRLQ